MKKTENINIRIEPELKQKAEDTVDKLGLTMAEAIKIFLKQVTLTYSIPFKIEMPRYNKETLEAIEEATRISNDKNTKTFENVNELLEELNN